jgi:FecR protein
MHEPGEALSQEERAAREAVHGLSVPEADVAYRAELRAAFVAGTFAEHATRVVHLRWWERESTRWAGAALAAAAALLAVVTLNRGPEWRLTALYGDGVAVIDGRPVPLAHTEEFVRWLRPGARVEMPPASDLEMVSDGVAAIQLSPGTAFTLPEPPGRWFWRRVHAEVESGEIRVTTGRAFHGARLAIRTHEADLMVTGTTFAVICEPEGTCVCVLEGTVMVGPVGQAMEPVTAGSRRYVFADGRTPERADMRDLERGKLAEFRAARRADLEGGPR